jgi:hypothetical protein
MPQDRPEEGRTVELHLKSGNPKPDPAFYIWRLRRHADGTIDLHFRDKEANLRDEEWDVFVKVVASLSPAMWRSNRVIPQLEGNRRARDLLRGCTDTPSFQLLLAGIDIVHAFRLTAEPVMDSALVDFRIRVHSIRSVFGPGSIYFVPPGFFADVPDTAIEELVANNRLGRADLRVNPQATRYYIPYAVPITLARTLSSQASQLWDTIRTEYYAFKYPLTARE